MTKKEALGKGIRALLEGIDDEVQSQGKSTASKGGKVEGTTIGGNVVIIPLTKIEVNPFQPRTNFDEESLQDLANSIKVHGVIQPITVRKLNRSKYQLIAGERRLRASKLAGLNEVPAYVREANDQESLEIALIENIQREDLNAVEIGINYQRLLDECDLTHEELSERLGKNRATITNYLRLLRLPPDIQAAIKNRDIGMGHARALLAIDGVEAQLAAFKEVVAGGMSVRKVEQLAAAYKKGSKKGSKSSKQESLPIEIRKYQDHLSSHLGTNVKIKPGKGGKGTIEITYYSDDDLDRLSEIISEE